MHYYIISQQFDPKPYQPSNTFSKCFSNYQSSISLQVHDHKLLKLRCSTQSKNGSKEFQVEVENAIQWNKIGSVWCGDNDWIIILSQPLKLYYVLQKYKTVVPIELPQEINLLQSQCYINFPDLYIYGRQPQKYIHSAHCLNLTTFEFKQVKYGKQYSPNGRSHFWSFFSDNRLYVTGGINKKGQKVDNLMWTYSIDNVYWFALQFMSEDVQLDDSYANCQIENGKVLSVNKNGIYLVQLYQSRVSKVEGWSQVLQPQQLQLIKNIYIQKDWIYLQLPTSLLPLRLKVAKR